MMMAITGNSHRSNGSRQLVRELGLIDATSVVVGTIIGSGIFLVPGNVAQRLESLTLVLVAWLVGGILSLFGALSLGELGAAFPGAGGLYVYLRQAYGRPVGFLYGWALISMIHSGSIATLAVAFSLFAARFVALDSVGQKAVSIACIVLLTIVNTFGIRHGKMVQNLFTTAKLGGLLTMILLLFYRGKPIQLINQSQLADVSKAGIWIPFGMSLVAILWAYEGWHVVSFTAAEIKEPRRTLPRSLIYGTLIIVTVYMLANVAYYSVLTQPELIASNAVAATAVQKAFGPVATSFISFLILVSIFGATNGMILTGPRVYYAMARDQIFFQFLGRVHPRHKTPHVAILVQGGLASLLTLLGTFQELFTYVIFTAWIFYGLAVAAVLVLRHRQPAMDRPYRVPAYPWPGLIFCAAAALITVNTIVADPLHSLVGIAFVLAGVLIYPVFRRRGARLSSDSTGDPF
jgi:APA family basic amino acid/polyamine antiporter